MDRYKRLKSKIERNEVLMEKEERWYRNNLERIPKPRQGYDCHSAIFGTACAGFRAGLSEEQIINDLCRNSNALEKGDRDYIETSVRNAKIEVMNEVKTNKNGGVKHRKFKKMKVEELSSVEMLIKIVDGNKEMMRQYVIDYGKNLPEYRDYWVNPQDFGEHDKTPFGTTILFLKTLYQPDDFILIGDVKGKKVKKVSEWIKKFESERARLNCYSPKWQKREFLRISSTSTQIIMNPFDGEEHPRKDGKMSRRCDAAIKEYRFVLGEFDKVPLAQQVPFWIGFSRIFEIEILALVYSGGKSIHAWLKTKDINTSDDWNTKIVNELAKLFKAFEVDSSCSNPSRMSRLPGIFRVDEKYNNWQKLIYLKEYTK